MLFDPTGKVSAPAELALDAGTCGGNAPAVDAMSASSAAPKTGEVVSLAATVTDSDTEPSCAAHAAAFTYDWAFTALPAGSRASLNDDGLASPSFVPDLAGAYALALSVTDPTGRSATGKYELTVTAAPPEPPAPDDDCGESPPVAIGRVTSPGPVAACGGKLISLNLQGNSRIQLDATASTDRDIRQCGISQTLDYEWTLLTTPITGGKSALENQNGATAVLHVVSDGAYRVRLVVRDSTGLSSHETVCWLHAGNVGWNQ